MLQQQQIKVLSTLHTVGVTVPSFRYCGDVWLEPVQSSDTVYVCTYTHEHCTATLTTSCAVAQDCCTGSQESFEALLIMALECTFSLSHDLCI